MAYGALGGGGLGGGGEGDDECCPMLRARLVDHDMRRSCVLGVVLYPLSQSFWEFVPGDGFATTYALGRARSSVCQAQLHWL